MNTKPLESILPQYIEMIEKGNPDEMYKWKALQNFQSNWNIDAKDFSSMFDASLQAESSNLWASMNYFPKKMILVFSNLVPEEVRKMFRMLFNEDIDLTERINGFLKGCNDFLTEVNETKELKDRGKQHYHKDMRAISFYLAFRYPEKYFTYKYTEVKKIAGWTQTDMPPMRSQPAEKYLWYLNMANDIRDFLMSHEKLRNIYTKWLTENSLIDPGFTFLTSDFIIQTANNILPKNEEKQEKLDHTREIGFNALELPSKNVIYYGPPGTGKTYKLRNELFTHFTEIKESLSDEDRNSDIAETYPWWQIVGAALLDIGSATVPELKRHELIRAKDAISDQQNVSAMIWSMLQTHTVNECENVKYSKRNEPLFFYKEQDSRWRVVDEHVDAAVPEIREILEKYKTHTEGAIEVRRYDFVTFHQSYSYEEFIEGIRPDAGDELTYSVTPGVFRRIAERARKDPENSYALFIDEINRANVSSVFGELITLLEEDKRLKAINSLTVTLPYSGNVFGVPENLFLIGTMNTADRSVEALDTALRRRFTFIEIEPDPTLLSENSGGVNLVRMLTTINSRIERLTDRDHRIGHAYFIDINDDDALSELRAIFTNQIIPLLQEYFYGDWSRIGLVLGSKFVKKEKQESSFATFEADTYDAYEDRRVFRITDPVQWTIEDFKGIYET